MQRRISVCVLSLLTLILGACASSAEKKAQLDAASNPELCKKALAEGAVPFEGLVQSEDWRYRWTLYYRCSVKAIKENPQICADILAAGRPPGADKFAPTKQEFQQSFDYGTCEIYAKKALENQSRTASGLRLDEGVYAEDGQSGSAQFGRIASVQVENFSRPGTSGGASLGAGVGQVAYLENTNLVSDYNPWSQIGAGLAGAALGSVLDEPSSVSFKKTYWIKLSSGEFTSIKQLDSSSGHLPEGMCVAILDKSRIQQAKEVRCKGIR